MNRTSVNVVTMLIWLVGVAVVAYLHFMEFPAAPHRAHRCGLPSSSASPHRSPSNGNAASSSASATTSAARSPGLFFIIPFVDRVASVIDQRVITSTFNAEETLTRDTVPVTVDAVLFWHVHDVERAPPSKSRACNAAVARASKQLSATSSATPRSPISSSAGRKWKSSSRT